MSKIVEARYEIVRSLGQGCHGTTFLVRHRQIPDHPFVLKIVSPEVIRNSKATEKFIAEALANENVLISHPNLVEVFEFFRDDDHFCFTMEYIEGSDLSQRLQKQKRLSVDEAIYILFQVTAGVLALHDTGIIHGNIKPQNIFLGDNGEVRTSDYLLAQIGCQAELAGIADERQRIEYYSPEYLQNGVLDEKTDIYALGVLAYEMISGTIPQRTLDASNAELKDKKNELTPLSTFTKNCPKELSELIMHALDSDPERRDQSCAEFKQKLARLKYLRSLH